MDFHLDINNAEGIINATTKEKWTWNIKSNQQLLLRNSTAS